MIVRQTLTEKISAAKSTTDTVPFSNGNNLFDYGFNAHKFLEQGSAPHEICDIEKADRLVAATSGDGSSSWLRLNGSLQSDAATPVLRVVRL